MITHTVHFLDEPRQAACYWCGSVNDLRFFDVYCLKVPVFGKRLTIHICSKKRLKKQYRKGSPARIALGGCRAAAIAEGYERRDDLTKAEREEAA